MICERRKGETTTGSIWTLVEGRQQTLCLDQDTGITHTHTLARKKPYVLWTGSGNVHPTQIAFPYTAAMIHIPALATRGTVICPPGQAHLNYEG